ncbi:MAG: hypothetical protein WCF33_02505 [Pseudonocardiaceae bacterium]
MAARRMPRKTNVQMSVRDPQSGIRIDLELQGDAGSIEKTVEEVFALVHAQRAIDADIVQLSSQIERTSNELLESFTSSAEKGRRGLFQLRNDLREAGIWSAEDIAKFDRVVQQRNIIVHGDRQDPEALKVAITEAKELLAALEARPSSQ